ncbi:hypothetical protein FOZ60_002181 [Perkinsus olseni]|uniref:Uncharacterized protein n=1 Tax=Perkinsus olseni TaxID=32597 RepID=A0A7J6NZQ5_PEROL|nr:hypothetical protein FOZ60_002181 [Perkinsus olseni]
MGGNRFSSGCDRLLVDPPPKLSPSLNRLQEKLNFDGFVSAPGGFGYELAVGDWLSEARHQGIETEVTAVVTSIDQRELSAVMRYCNSEGTALGLIGDARELLASSPALKASAVKRSLICYSIASTTRSVNVSTGDGGERLLRVGISTPGKLVASALRELGLHNVEEKKCWPLLLPRDCVREIQIVTTESRKVRASRTSRVCAFEHFVASGCIMFGSPSQSGREYNITSVVCDLLFDVDELRRKVMGPSVDDPVDAPKHSSTHESTNGALRFLLYQSDDDPDNEIGGRGINATSFEDDEEVYIPAGMQSAGSFYGIDRINPGLQFVAL